ncbi:uncharacterized protein TNCV_4473381 [Trichonephila clavipes]|uniref:RNase H type-1 domain-containing protein n=1 Tax=Trichonephila clavipes TaxID=2585209 RepID=A0A8X6SHM0_TRICX|nr:uncharacterized protein TNCV_4473381 [Trichonephila clavipes]
MCLVNLKDNKEPRQISNVSASPTRPGLQWYQDSNPRSSSHEFETITRKRAFTQLCALRAIALETINTRYLPDEWQHIPTDGSFLAVILSDSSSALQALVSNQGKQSSRVQEFRELMRSIPTRVVFQRVPSHYGFWGNEMKDLFAKRGTDIHQRSTTELALHSTKLEINRIYKNCFRDAATIAAKNKSWRVLIKPNCVSDSPRAAAVAEFILLAGHDCLCVHLYRFNLTDSPFCVLCASGQS